MYLSDQKLRNLTAQFRIRTASSTGELDVEAGAALSAGLPAVGEMAAHGTVRGRRSDPGKRERLLLRRLEQLERRLADLPDLERGESVREGEWFRFHRRLRFGLGQSDSPPLVTAFLMVDHEPVPEGPLVPGLLMNGSVAHVRPPYGTDALPNTPARRSGSGTGELFIWLEELREALEANPTRTLARSKRSWSTAGRHRATGGRL